MRFQLERGGLTWLGRRRIVAPKETNKMGLPNLPSALGQIYPPDRFLTARAQLLPYESDALTVFRARPLAVVLPQTQEEVIETVRLCHREKLPFVARGSGTSLSGGSLPIEEGIVIGLNRLNRILELDPQERIAVVQPGVINLDVSSAAAPHNLYYAPDPSSQSVCTIGGNVAFNSGGAHCLLHGMTSNHVLGIKAVLPDGEIVRLGGRSLERIGPDLTGFYVGSEGLFGIALEITLRLVPRPETYRTLLAAYRSLEAAGEAVARIVAAGILPGAIEIMDRLALKAAEAAVHAGYPEGAAALLIVELEGESIEVDPEFASLQKIIEASGSYEIRVAQDEADRARIWKGRKGAFSSVGRLSPDYIVQDGVVPRSRLGEALAEIERLSSEFDIPVANVFHAGDGNLHPLILFDGNEEGALERAEELAGLIVRMCIRLGGSITGEHGIGMEKRAYLAEMFNRTDMENMIRIRRSLDPYELSNRTKMFPEMGEVPPLEAKPPAPAIGSTLQPKTVEEVCQSVRSFPSLVCRGGGSKPALSRASQTAQILDLSRLSGVLEYQPEEFTFTALAGTAVAQVQQILSQEGQYLPFDPVLAGRGATMGGTVAAGTSGSGRQRHGGIRDFLLGVSFVNGGGELVRGGAKVVKNAAGFDLPKLMIGSLGCLGVLVDLTFKVFPRPRRYVTLELERPNLADALEQLSRLKSSGFNLEAVDLEPPGKLWVRLGGNSETLSGRLDRLRNVLGRGEARTDEEESSLWQRATDFAWSPAGASLVKIPVTLALIPSLEEHLSQISCRRRYCSAGNLLWLAWTDALERLESILQTLGLGGLLLDGPGAGPFLGLRDGQVLTQRIKQALDSQGRFPDY